MNCIILSLCESWSILAQLPNLEKSTVHSRVYVDPRISGYEKVGNRWIVEKQEPEMRRHGKIQKLVEFLFTFVTDKK
jgi:hypothetical protein